MITFHQLYSSQILYNLHHVTELSLKLMTMPYKLDKKSLRLVVTRNRLIPVICRFNRLMCVVSEFVIVSIIMHNMTTLSLTTPEIIMALILILWSSFFIIFGTSFLVYENAVVSMIFNGCNDMIRNNLGKLTRSILRMMILYIEF